jgi:hypothetical protein
MNRWCASAPTGSILKPICFLTPVDRIGRRVRLRTLQSQVLSHRYKPGLRLHPLNPSSDLREIIERKAAFVRDMRVSE